MQHSRVMKDRDRNVVTDDKSETGRWKECFDELMIEENERVEEVNIVDQEVVKVGQAEVRRALKRMTVGPDVLPVEVWNVQERWQ